MVVGAKRARECARAAREAYAQQRDEAHEQLDRDGGWSAW
jgi:hypothetical protein